jgi:hypothetical protein
MKKSIILAFGLVIAGLLSGCASVPKHYNMTGNWRYTFEEKGGNEVQNGTMSIYQDGYKLRGQANDAFGEFNLQGSISENGPKFTIEGKRNDYKRSFRLNGTLASDNKFEGTYTTDQNTSGTMKGERTSVD